MSDLPALHPEPKVLGDMRISTTDTRYYDLSPDLAPLGDALLTWGVAVARVDGRTSDEQDLAVSPQDKAPPWLTVSDGYPSHMLVVNWWQRAGAAVAEYVVTVSVTTAQGRSIAYDATQTVVEEIG
jgi:hypothetical protein